MLSGYPHLEEAYWFGEGVLPVLRERGLWAGARGLSEAVGEYARAGDGHASVPFTVGGASSAAAAGLEVAGVVDVR